MDSLAVLSEYGAHLNSYEILTGRRIAGAFLPGNSPFFGRKLIAPRNEWHSEISLFAILQVSL